MALCPPCGGAMTPDIKGIFSRIEGYKDEIIGLQKELTSRIAIGPKNGGTGEYEKARYLRERLGDLKPEFLEEIKASDEQAEGGYRPNLLAGWGGEGTGSRVWVLSHMDIVPPGDLSLWQSDPYKITVEGDRIIGRGVLDNHQGIISSYLSLKAILEFGLRPVRPVGLAFVADEETGSAFGLEYILSHHRDFFKESDLIVVPDGGNEEGTMIEIAEKSMLWLRFTVLGKQCHASMPDRGKNSLVGASRLIVALDRLKETFSKKDGLFRPEYSTLEPTKIEANVGNINTIPGKDLFYLDCRILPHYGVDQVLEEAGKIAAEVGAEIGMSIEVEEVYRQENSNPTPVDAPVVRALSSAIKLVTGKDASPRGIGGGTVAAFFRKAGLPAAVWMTSPDCAHQPNEYCHISNVISDAKIFACLYMDHVDGN